MPTIRKLFVVRKLLGTIIGGASSCEKLLGTTGGGVKEELKFGQFGLV